MFIALTKQFDEDGKLVWFYKSRPFDDREELVESLEGSGFKGAGQNLFEADAADIAFLFDKGWLEAKVLDLSDESDRDEYVAIFKDGQPAFYPLETITARYAVYERGLLKSVKWAKRYGPYANCDTFLEAVQQLKDIHDLGLNGFILDRGTGTIFDYAEISEIC